MDGVFAAAREEVELKIKHGIEPGRIVLPHLFSRVFSGPSSNFEQGFLFLI